MYCTVYNIVNTMGTTKHLQSRLRRRVGAEFTSQHTFLLILLRSSRMKNFSHCFSAPGDQSLISNYHSQMAAANYGVVAVAAQIPVVEELLRVADPNCHKNIVKV
uniref:Uncharacterized protein n=1 Tax=Rhizophora mucronata TaxID=61149 RepID=A0A2P2M4Y0_RHIMU